MKAYSKIIDDYIRLYPQLNHDPKFVFEYAMMLNAEKRYEQADSILLRGLRISCDPMFYNVKGRNYHEMGAYRKAEACYMNATYLIPERIYPYYLLTKCQFCGNIFFRPLYHILTGRIGAIQRQFYLFFLALYKI